MTEFDVVIAGAGPTGLLLACELRLGGVEVLVAERLTEVDETVKAMSVNTPSATALDRRGFFPTLAAIQERAMERFRRFREERGEDLPQPPKFAGHFAGIPLDGAYLDPDDPAWADTGRADQVGLIPQAELERVLAARARELGVAIRRGVEVTGFEEDGGGVTVRLTGTRAGGGYDVSGAGGAEAEAGEGSVVRTGWLVGCDGGRSTVRKLAGFDFPGTGPSFTAYQAIVDLDGELNRGWNHTPTGVYASGPVKGRIMMIEYDGPPATREVTAEILEASLRRVSGRDVRITAVHTATVFTDNTRQATTYRRGNVLLAGDAAHVHSPFGGQGLNLGLQDALNLGWKLATGDSALIDTYTAERHPVAERVLRNTMAQVALTRPDPQARELYALFSDLLDLPEVKRRISAMVQGADIRYDTDCDHPLAGTFVPGLDLSDGKGTTIALDGESATIRPDGYISWISRGSERTAGRESLRYQDSGCP